MQLTRLSMQKLNFCNINTPPQPMAPPLQKFLYQWGQRVLYVGIMVGHKNNVI